MDLNFCARVFGVLNCYITFFFGSDEVESEHVMRVKDPDDVKSVTLHEFRGSDYRLFIPLIFCLG